jgi:hypothetical protein
MSSNHRTGQPGPDTPSDDDIAAEAARGISSLQAMLADAAPSPTKIKTTAGEARRRAFAIVADACERAIDTPGLTAPALRRLALDYEDAGRDPLPHLMRHRYSPEKQAQSQWCSEHREIAKGAGGVLAWDALDWGLRHVLFYDSNVATVAAIRDLADRGELQSLKWIGPAREQQIHEALASTDEGAA